MSDLTKTYYRVPLWKFLLREDWSNAALAVMFLVDGFLTETTWLAVFFFVLAVAEVGILIWSVKTWQSIQRSGRAREIHRAMIEQILRTHQGEK